MNKIFYTLLLVFMTQFSFAQQDIVLSIRENKVPCNNGVAKTDCYQVKFGKDTTWQYFYNNIEGFNYQPGYKYKIIVTKQDKKGLVPADASSVSYTFKKLLSQKWVGKKQSKNESGFWGRKMVLTQMNGNTIAPSKVFVTFDPKTKTIFGKSGCNSFRMSYKEDPSGVKIESKQGATTMMACDEQSMILERTFLNTLENKKFEITQADNQVFLSDMATNKVTLVFNIPSQEQIWSSINNKEWHLIQLDNVGADYGKAAIRFDVAGKRVSGNSGVNRFTSPYVVKGDKITFSRIASTLMGSTNPEATATEGKFVKNLSIKNLRYELEGNVLTFYNGNRAVMVFRDDVMN